MHKIMLLTDSCGNPRSFPLSEITMLEETFPYLLRQEIKDSIFYQLSFGNLTTEELLSQAISYHSHWNPDIIIVLSGIAESRPEAFTEFQKVVLKKLSIVLIFDKLILRFNHWIKKLLYNPALIKRHQFYRVSKSSFRKTLKKFKLIFSKSKIYWLEISAGPKHDDSRPGVIKRMESYNAIIKEIYGDDFVPVQQKLMVVEGFNGSDHVHLSKRGHKLISDILLERINKFLDQKIKLYEQNT